MSQPVREYYDSNADKEGSRLDLPLCQIEFRSTLRLIRQYFPVSGRICDLGCGAGRYSIELARRGYRTTLFDLSERLLDRARSVFAEHRLQAERFIRGDARDLGELESGGYDAALLLGPMYHVIDP